jgi:hypothetical protein
MTAMISNMFGRFLGTMTGQTHLRFVMLESSATQIADPYREGGSEAKILSDFEKSEETALEKCLL